MENQKVEEMMMAIVVRIINDYEIVINKGIEDGVKSKDRFLVYCEKEEIHDPITKESLGKLEVIRGEAKVKHLQGKMSTLVTAMFDTEAKKVIRKNPMMMAFGTEEEVTYGEKTRIPFDDIALGDYVRKIR